MLGLLSNSPPTLLLLGLLFLVLVAGTLALEHDGTRAWLRRRPWFRRLEALPAHELRFRGMVSLGFGLCSFAALLTLRLFVPALGSWPGLVLAMLAVVAITLGAALLERAAQLQGLR